MSRILLRGLLGLALLPILFSSCIRARSDRGVEARWHEIDPASFQSGTTTRREILDLLGPPSQILSFEGGTAFYYLLETTQSNGTILLVYNVRNEETSYDRAVFFFDEEGLLSDFATTEEPAGE